MLFLVTASPSGPLDVVTSNFKGAHVDQGTWKDFQGRCQRSKSGFLRLCIIV